MSVDERVLAVIRSVYDAALDEALWPRALRELTDVSGSQAATFWVLDSSEQPRLPVFTAVNLDPKPIEEYLSDIAPLDPTVQYLVRHPDRAIVHDALVITEREKDKHPYYDWHDRYFETRFRMVGQVHPAPFVQAGVALHRTRRAGRFEPNDIERFAFIYAHLEKALAIGFRLGAAAALQQCTAELLDRNPAAVLLLDAHKRILHGNRAAAALRSGSDGLCWSGDRVAAQRPQDDAALQDRIAEALASAAAGGGVVRVTRPSGKKPYTILVVPVTRRCPALAVQRPAICLVITDPEDRTPLPEARIRAAFDLTVAEARLAALLAGGMELRTAAADLKITYGTARARLAAIFEKTGTRRQGELVKLVLSTFAIG